MAVVDLDRQIAVLAFANASGPVAEVRAFMKQVVLRLLMRARTA